jgi:hypothetical protein
MPKNPEAPNFHRFEQAPKKTENFDVFRGVNLEADPGATPIGEFRSLINVIINENDIFERYGQVKAIAVGQSAAVIGLFDTTSGDAPPRGTF